MNTLPILRFGPVILCLLLNIGEAQVNWSADSLQSIIESSATPDSQKFGALYRICQVYDDESDYEQLLAWSSQLLHTARIMRVDSLNGYAYEKMCASYWHLGDFQQALAHGDSAISNYERLGNERRIMTTTYLVGMVHMQGGSYQEAIQSYYSAIGMAKEQEDTVVLGIILNSVASLQMDIGNYEQAKQDFLESISLLQGEQYAYRRGMSLANLGTLYHDQDNYEEAIKQFNEAENIFTELGAERWRISVRGNKGGSLLNMERYDEALPLLEENAAYFEGGDPIYESESKAILARAHHQLGNLNKAEGLYQVALELSVQAGLGENQRRHLENLARISEEQGQFKEAYKRLTEAKALGDSLYEESLVNRIAELTEELEAEKREEEIGRLSAENSLQAETIKNERLIRFGLIGLIGIVFLMGGLVIEWRRRQTQSRLELEAKNQEIREAVHEQEKTDLSLKALRAQMDPHFIFNSMNSINRLILENRNEEATDNLTKFSRLVRMILEHSAESSISLQQELDMMDLYLKLENRRLGGDMNVSLNIPKELDPDDINVPSMILQPFLENAIWHGLMNKAEGSRELRISIQEEELDLVCEIEDNGIGRKAAAELQPTNHQSMAVDLTNQRLALIGRQQDSRVQIRDLYAEDGTANGTNVRISIPI